MKSFREHCEELDEMTAFNTGFPNVDRTLDRVFRSKKYRGASKFYTDLYKKQKQSDKMQSVQRHDLGKKAASITGVDFRTFEKIFHAAIMKGEIPKELGWVK